MEGEPWRGALLLTVTVEEGIAVATSLPPPPLLLWEALTWALNPTGICRPGFQWLPLRRERGTFPSLEVHRAVSPPGALKPALGRGLHQAGG